MLRQPNLQPSSQSVFSGESLLDFASFMRGA